MKKTLLAVPALAALALMAGCATPEHFGVLISDTTHPRQVTTNPIGSKVGKATLKNVLGFAQGDAGIAAAAKNGGITKIGAVDVHVKNTLGLVSETTTIVYGE
ncbi:MAG: TRL-like family protein [Puniceicoccales bacterium]|jgi:uncharacterized lipoprotein YajG|nr:TRL-like family protein [Puniceicoccales bacterium]